MPKRKNDCLSEKDWQNDWWPLGKKDAYLIGKRIILMNIWLGKWFWPETVSLIRNEYLDMNYFIIKNYIYFKKYA